MPTEEEIKNRDFRFYLERAEWLLENAYVPDRDLHDLAHELMAAEQPDAYEEQILV